MRESSMPKENSMETVCFTILVAKFVTQAVGKATPSMVSGFYITKAQTPMASKLHTGTSI